MAYGLAFIVYVQSVSSVHSYIHVSFSLRRFVFRYFPGGEKLPPFPASLYRYVLNKVLVPRFPKHISFFT
jgi:hypothetical protein